MRMTKEIADRAARGMVQNLHNNMIPELEERDQIIFDLYRSYIKDHDMKFFLENPHLFESITGFYVKGNGIPYHSYVGFNNASSKLPWFPYLREHGISPADFNQVLLEFNKMDSIGAKKSDEYVKACIQIDAKKKEIKKLEEKIYNTIYSFTTVAKAIIAFPEAKDYLPVEKKAIVLNVPSLRIEEILRDLKMLGYGNKQLS